MRFIKRLTPLASLAVIAVLAGCATERPPYAEKENYSTIIAQFCFPGRVPNVERVGLRTVHFGGQKGGSGLYYVTQSASNQPVYDAPLEQPGWIKSAIIYPYKPGGVSFYYQFRTRDIPPTTNWSPWQLPDKTLTTSGQEFYDSADKPLFGELPLPPEAPRIRYRLQFIMDYVKSRRNAKNGVIPACD